MEMFGFTKVHYWFSESHSYFTSATTAVTATSVKHDRDIQTVDMCFDDSRKKDKNNGGKLLRDPHSGPSWADEDDE